MPARTFTEKEKALLENAARSCPVALSLHPDIAQTLRFVYA
jgi:putative redox protein